MPDETFHVDFSKEICAYEFDSVYLDIFDSSNVGFIGRNVDCDPCLIEKLKCEYIDPDNFIQNSNLTASESVCSVFWNARSVRKNLEEMLLELEVWKCNIHVLCLAETWLTPDTQPLFRIDGYKPFYQSRVQRGGGVAIFIKENYTAQTMDDVSYISESLECVFVRANNNVGSFVIGCLYRPPKSNIDDFLVKLE